MNLQNTHPSIRDLRRSARRQIPHFVWEYLDSGTGQDHNMGRNRDALAEVVLNAAILGGPVTPDLTTRILGQEFAAPFGVAPIGMSGLIWPNAERLLAQTAREANVPYCLSTNANQPPEVVGPVAGDNGWFQLYNLVSRDIEADLLRRARESGFKTLVLTVDVPAASRRERQRRAGIPQPPATPGISPRLMLHAALRPRWALGTLRYGRPKLRSIEPYVPEMPTAQRTLEATKLVAGQRSWDDLEHVRKIWPGNMILKGVMQPKDAQRARDAGVNAVWVSNHSGRQFDAAPSSLSALQAIRAALGPDYPLFFDGGTSGGLDILRAIACGADFVMMGRAWHFGLGTAGKAGARHVFDMLCDDMIANMGQMGIATPPQARDHRVP